MANVFLVHFNYYQRILLQVLLYRRLLSKKSLITLRAVAQLQEHPSNGPQLVQLSWRGFESRLRRKVVGKIKPSRAIGDRGF